jgi:hypothetical protein
LSADDPNPAPDVSALETLYQESWKEYHHTEYMVFVYLAAAVAADVALLQGHPTILGLSIASVLGLTAVLVTVRQIESRSYRMENIERVEKVLRIDSLIGKENRSALSLGTTLILLSVLLFAIPVLWLFFAFFGPVRHARILSFDYSLLTAIGALLTAVAAWVGLIIACKTLHFVHYRKAVISSILGPKIMIFYRYRDQEKKKETIGLIAPVTFVNTAVRPGIVKSAGLLLYGEQTPDERFYLEWDKFGQLEGEKDNKKWVHGEEASPLTVLGNSSVAKMVFFYWFDYSAPELILRDDLYHVVLCYWIYGNEGKMPAKDYYEMRIDARKLKLLEDVRKATPSPDDKRQITASSTVYFWLDGKRKLGQNQSMNKAESENLLALSHS